MMIADSVEVEELQEVFWADCYFKEIICEVCGRREWSCWRAHRKGGSSLVPICSDCAVKLSRVKVKREGEAKVC